MGPLIGKTVLIPVEDAYEDLELWYPKLRLEEAGAHVVVAGPEAGRTYRGKHGYPCVADAALADVSTHSFSAVVLPGGFAPDKLRRRDDLKAIVRALHAAEKPIAHICHGGWIAISADVVRGFQATGSPGIRDDLVNAGATWVDAPVVCDRHQISSRGPADLPVFMKEVIAHLSDPTGVD